MAKSWKNLHFIVKLIFKLIPPNIAAECKKILPSEVRHISLGEKFEFYYFADKAHLHMPQSKRHLIGEFLWLVDQLSA